MLSILALLAALVPGDTVRTLMWDDLLPEGELAELERLYIEYFDALQNSVEGGLDSIVEGSAEDQMVQLGTFNVVESLNGKRVRLPGYLVPLDAEPITEALLVPYFGACLHLPPPPPNQIVHVKLPSQNPISFSDIAHPFWIEGVMRTDTTRSELAAAAYRIEEPTLSEYRD